MKDFSRFILSFYKDLFILILSAFVLTSAMNWYLTYASSESDPTTLYVFE